VSVSAVEVLKVSLVTKDPEGLLDCALDAPAAGDRRDAFVLHLRGWVVARKARPVAINVRYHDSIIRSLPLNYPRPDLAAQHPEFAEDADDTIQGFDGLVGVVGLDPEFELELRVVLEDETRLPFASVRARHEPLRSKAEPRVQPIVLTSLPRTGTTRMMEMLARHPDIVVYRHYPYEYSSAQYWAHALKVLAEPENALQSSRRGSFHENIWSVGHNPFWDRHVDEDERLGNWFGKTYVESLAAFVQKSTDDWYATLAAAQGQGEPLYFAEKCPPGHVPATLAELYPRGKEIFLVRDFRDMACSVFDFWAGRTAETSRDQAESDQEYIRWLGGSARDLYRDWEVRRERAHLVKYEDMVLRPTETMTGVLRYLDLDAGDTAVERLIGTGPEEQSRFQQHRTSSSAEASIGRYERDLNGALKQACEEAFSETLTAFGYAS
jgi:hypothetical protein